MARGQWRIVVTELPYDVSSRLIEEQIEELSNPKIKKDKKSLSPEQAADKADLLGVLEQVRDESDKDEPIRLMLTPKSSKQDPEALMAYLFAKTSLESSFSLNMTVLALNGKPRVQGLKEQLTEWVAFRRETVTRRTVFELKQAEDRLHILEGRQLVYLNVDDVVATIRSADDPKLALKDRFKLSDRQAIDILDMQLRALARLEGIKIEKEIAEKTAEAIRLRKLLASDQAMRGLITKELSADRDKYGDDRRTLIKFEEPAAVQRAVADEPCTIVISKNLWVRRLPGHEVQQDSVQYKPGDSAFVFLQSKTSRPLLFLDSKGRAYSVDVSALPTGRGDGVPVTTLIELQGGARITAAMSDALDTQWLFSGQDGLGFISPLGAMVARPRAGKAFLKLADNELPMPPVPLPSDNSGQLVCGSTVGKVLVFPLSEVKVLEKGGGGVALMFLEPEEKLTCVRHVTGEPIDCMVSTGATTAKLRLKGEELAKHIGHRNRKGAFLPKKAVLQS